MKKEIATMSRTKEIMQQYGLHTKKGFGQNFITDANIVRNIAIHSQVTEESAAIEIGPGIGALTQQLAMRAKKVVAYEIDTQLIPVLQDTLQEYPNVQVVNQDFLEVDFAQLVADLKQDCKEVVVAANLPYYITTPILFRIFESKSAVDRILVMMQKEVADRFGAKVNTKEYNALTIMTQYLWDVRIVMKVSRNVFEPKPNVDSAVVEFKRKETVTPVYDQEVFFRLVKACFEQRRKTILNNYQAHCSSKLQAQENLEQAGIACQQRAESVTLEQFIRLYQIHREHGHD